MHLKTVLMMHFSLMINTIFLTYLTINYMLEVLSLKTIRKASLFSLYILMVEILPQ